MACFCGTKFVVKTTRLVLKIYLKYEILKVSLLSNTASCTSNSECCCGQYCIANTCQCTSDRFWNSALPYCRKFNFD